MAPAKKKSCRYPLIPEEERKCVWMTTGFISYKLCDKGFQCETCPFDRAIRNDQTGDLDFQEWETGEEELLNSDSFSRMNGATFYHPSHCWAQVENPEKVKVGIDDLLAQLLMSVKVITLPMTGSYCWQGECCAHLIRDDYILPVASPLSGSIQAVNSRLRKEPELIVDDPRGDGWLISVKPENLEVDLKNLLFGRKARSWYQKEEKELISQAESLLKESLGTVGPTMQDGGIRIYSLPGIFHSLTPPQRSLLLDFSIRKTPDRGHNS